MNKDIYPLTAEEFEQTEKVTSTEVLEVLNNADVEVEQSIVGKGGQSVPPFSDAFFKFFMKVGL